MISLTVGGLSYSYPQTGDTNWGTGATGWAQAVTADMLSVSGGVYTLTADLSLGSNFGLVALYFKSITANIAASGILRLANTDTIAWRNAANSADVSLGVDTSNSLAFNSVSFLSSAGVLLAAGYPATTGDVTSTAGSLATTVAKIQGKTVSGTTGTGNVVFSASPTFTGTSAFAALTATTPMAIAYGGTGQTTAAAAFNALSPMTTGGDLIYGGASGAATRLANGTAGYFLQSNGTTLAPTWVAAPGSGTVTSVTFTGDGTVLSNTPSSAVTTIGTVTGSLLSQTKNTGLWGPSSGSNAAPTFRAPVYADVLPSFKYPTVQRFTSTGSTTGYLFTVSSANATAGATYTNNGNTYTVLSSISAGTQLFCSQASAPTSSGTLTKASGTGDSTITFSAYAALGTYTAPTNPAPLYIRIRMVGGGGGGAGSGTAAGSAAGAGGTTAFGAGLLIANGGSGGAVATSGSPTNGGSASLGSGPVGIALTGGSGGIGAYNYSSGSSSMGVYGAASPFGGAGPGGGVAEVGVAATANTGSGGGGGGSSNAAGNMYSGSGGAAGGFVDAIITSLSSTYPYVVGAAGGAGGNGASGSAGGAGAAGIIVVEEFYQ